MTGADESSTWMPNGHTNPNSTTQPHYANTTYSCPMVFELVKRAVLQADCNHIWVLLVRVLHVVHHAVKVCNRHRHFGHVPAVGCSPDPAGQCIGNNPILEFQKNLNNNIYIIISFHNSRTECVCVFLRGWYIQRSQR